MPRYEEENIESRLEDEEEEEDYPQVKAFWEDDEMTEEERLAEELASFGSMITKEAEDVDRLRRPIEERWIEDIRQYNGQYDPAVESALKVAGKSQAYVNVTRPKTHVAMSRLSDMLFPTDDKNYSVTHTPIPDLGKEGQEPVLDNEGQPIPNEMGEAMTVYEGLIKLAEKKAEAMELEIDDQLTEAKYNAIGRDVIHDACLVGTGILKGPVITTKSRKKWVAIQDPETGETMHELQFVEESKPTVEYVDPFHFFPDPSAPTIEDCEFIFQRHYMTRKQMVQLSKRPDFIKSQVGKVLKEAPKETPPSYLPKLRALSGTTVESTEKRYLVWERHGEITKDVLAACGCDVDEGDEFTIYDGVVWVCDGIVIKAVINPMESQEQIYSVYNFEKDTASIFGYGVPFLLRHPQRTVNAAFRMMMDNGGLASGPIIVVNDEIIEPVPNEDGTVSWNLTPRKVFRMTDRTRNVGDAFEAFNVDSHIGELKEILMIAKDFADIETGLPLIAQGEQGGEVTKTFKGMELLMNSSNVVLRRSVKNYDDDVTVPLITRFYDFNMQFNPKEEIKGDMTCDARGSSALLLKETQARNITVLYQMAMTPPFSEKTDFDELYRLIISSLQFNPDDLMKSEEQLKKEEAERQQQQGQQQDPEAQKAAAMEQAKADEAQLKQQQAEMSYAMHREKLEDNQRERQARMEMKLIDRENAMMQLAENRELKDKEIMAKLKEIILKNQGERQKIADEAAIKRQYGSGI